MKITKKYVNDLSYRVVGCAIEVHKQLGPGLLESVYEKCMIEELKLQGIPVVSQIHVPLFYKGKEINQLLKLDLLIDNLIIVENKAAETMIPLYSAQLLTYLKLAEKPKGLLINFNCENITQNLVPLVTEQFAQLPES